ncbi:MAG TPA: hypothetical protein VFA10_18905 [Ktedonobacteraceae bacterium]|nr:hypothetical protein [Ktedonobacteraceae bacterium]
MSLNSNDPYQAPFSSSSWEDTAGPNDPTVISHTAYGPGFSAPPPPPSLPIDPYVLPPSPAPKKSMIISVLGAVIVVLLIVVGVLGSLLYRRITAPTTSPSTSTTPLLTAPNLARTATVPTTQYPFSSRLALDDPLTNASGVATYGWGVSTDSRGGCTFADGAYEVTTTQPMTLYCPTHRATFWNFTYEIQMRFKTGGTGAMGGVIFRHQLGMGKNYLFILGTDGTYELDVTTSSTSGHTLSSGTISGFASGLNQLHTIGIVANGPVITIYVDQQSITQVSDSTYNTSGSIGIVSHYGTSPTTVAFTNAKVWQL